MRFQFVSRSMEKKHGSSVKITETKVEKIAAWNVYRYTYVNLILYGFPMYVTLDSESGVKTTLPGQNLNQNC